MTASRNPAAQIRIDMLAGVASRATGRRIYVVHGEGLRDSGALDLRGRITQVQFNRERGLLLFNGSGDPGPFQVFVNLAFAPYEITRGRIMFGDGCGGAISILEDQRGLTQ